MQRILFVDDEPKLLSGLRRMLRGIRSDWTFEFAESGATALERLAQQAFDVVVSDIRMPGMDGSELLRLVREQFPSTVRMVLSGQCDRHAVLNAVGTAHQFLTKPCNSETLKDSLGRACQLRDQMTAPEARRLVSLVEAVPSRPASLAALTDALACPTGCIDRIGQIIASEPGMAARVLQLVNSGFYGSPQRIVDPRRAAGLLGQERLRELAASTKAFAATMLCPTHSASIARVVEHSQAVAEAAQRIAEAESDNPDLIVNARWGGLLHDVGILVLVQQAADRYAGPAPAAADDQGVCRYEQNEFGADHAMMGAYLLALWGLSDTLVHIAALHHLPSKSDDRAFSALTAVHAADVLCRNSDTGPGLELDHQYIERIGKADRVSAWAELCRLPQPDTRSQEAGPAFAEEYPSASATAVFPATMAPSPSAPMEIASQTAGAML